MNQWAAAKASTACRGESGSVGNVILQNFHVEKLKSAPDFIFMPKPNCQCSKPMFSPGQRGITSEVLNDGGNLALLRELRVSADAPGTAGHQQEAAGGSDRAAAFDRGSPLFQRRAAAGSLTGSYETGKRIGTGPAVSVLPLKHHFYLFRDMTLLIKNTQLWSSRISINKKKIFDFDLF